MTKVHAPSSQILIALNNPAELFEGPPPGRLVAYVDDWDAAGEILGEPGMARALRQLNANRRATGLVIQIREPSDDPAGSAEQMRQALEAWCHAKIMLGTEQARLSRRVGLRMLAYCTGLLALMLFLSSLLQSEDWFGPPGPLRTLASEAIVIAAWVAMWRPFEMVLFDPLRPRYESRLVRSLLKLPCRVETLCAPQSGR